MSYDPKQDLGMIKGLTFLRDLLRRGYKGCEHCVLYLDKRVKCYHKYNGHGCNQWKLSPKIKEEFDIFGVEQP